ncbi:hypothetical protein QQ045_011276 [Rhodiola kirilowii]
MEQDVDALVTKLDGECCLTVSKDEVSKAGSKFRWALVMKVMMDKKVKDKLLWDTLRDVWVLAGKVSFIKLSDKVFVANFQSKEDQEKILEGGPWTYMGKVIVMKRWEPGIAPDNFRHNSIQMTLSRFPKQQVGLHWDALRSFAVSSEMGNDDDMLSDSQYEGMETEKCCNRRVDQELDVEMNVETLKSLAQTPESGKADELLKEDQEAALVAEGAVEDFANTDKQYMMQKMPNSDVSHSGPKAAQFQNAGPAIVLNGNEKGLSWVDLSAKSKEAKVKRRREGKTQLSAKADGKRQRKENYKDPLVGNLETDLAYDGEKLLEIPIFTNYGEAESAAQLRLEK